MQDTASRNVDCVIDHGVLLISTEDFERPPPWLSDNFNILEGGNHQGQASRNKLIVFKDGTYIELFNWYDKPPDEGAKERPMKVWSKKKPGLIDFALSSLASTAESYVYGVNTRLDDKGGDGRLGVTYGGLIPGGRTRKDGVHVRWKISRPEFSKASNTPDDSLFPGGRLDAPFFLHDVTDLDVRVPFDDPEKTSHPCGATGISAVEVLVPASKVEAYVKLYSNILDSPPGALIDHHGEKSVALDLGLPVTKMGRSAIHISSALNEGQDKWLKERGIGISGLVLRREGRKGRGKERLGSEGSSSTFWLET